MVTFLEVQERKHPHLCDRTKFLFDEGQIGMPEMRRLRSLLSHLLFQVLSSQNLGFRPVRAHKSNFNGHLTVILINEFSKILHS